MISRRIRGAHRNLAKPRDWKATHPPCGDLWVRVVDAGRPGGETILACESAWEPTPDELAALNAGGSVILRVCGGQPPVSLYVELPQPEEADAAPADH